MFLFSCTKLLEHFLVYYNNVKCPRYLEQVPVTSCYAVDISEQAVSQEGCEEA